MYQLLTLSGRAASGRYGLCCLEETKKPQQNWCVTAYSFFLSSDNSVDMSESKGSVYGEVATNA